MNNVLMVPVLAVGFALLPFYYVKFTASKHKKQINPELEKKLRDEAFEKSKNEKGEYQCACCGRTGTSRVAFQVDHIVPMNAGGKTVPENLQILCRQCNGEKSDRV